MEEWNTSQCFQIQVTFGPFHSSFSGPGYSRRLLAKTAAEWVRHFFYYRISYRIVEFRVICGIWLDYKKKENGIKENREEKGSGVIGTPLW